MENKQTAVDWLIQELLELDKKLNGRRNNEDSTVFKINPTKIYQRAKQIEKDQIMEACGVGFNDGQAYIDGNPKFQSAEQYYNKTYGK